MYLDKVKISIKSGNGGDGSVSFHREKYVANGGPDGGDGGNGGAIIFRATNKKNTLIDFMYENKFISENDLRQMAFHQISVAYLQIHMSL